jgi:hypothetical protein
MTWAPIFVMSLVLICVVGIALTLVMHELRRDK